jgi:tetratricopeptide (TPR) repeat protein
MPYLLQRATAYYHLKEWKAAYLWVKYLERHFDEVRLETQDEEPFFRHNMEQHLVRHFPLYGQTCLLAGNALFHQDQIDSASQIFLKMQEVLKQFNRHYSGRQRNTLLLKVANNQAACHYKLRRNEEALHLFKTLSTAQGDFGQIIERNLQACTA